MRIYLHRVVTWRGLSVAWALRDIEVASPLMSAINDGLLKLPVRATRWAVFEKYYVGLGWQNGEERSDDVNAGR